MSKWTRVKGVYAQWTWGDYSVWLQARPRDNARLYAAQYRDERPWLIDNATFREAREACDQHALNQKLSTAVKIFDEQAAFPAERYDGPPVCDLATYCALLPDHEKVVAERDKLREFVEAFIRDLCWGLDVDGGSVQDLAEKLGLIVKVPHDPDTCDENCPCEGYLELYFTSWSKQGLAAKAQTPR